MHYKQLYLSILEINNFRFIRIIEIDNIWFYYWNRQIVHSLLQLTLFASAIAIKTSWVWAGPHLSFQLVDLSQTSQMVSDVKKIILKGILVELGLAAVRSALSQQEM